MATGTQDRDGRWTSLVTQVTKKAGSLWETGL
jgi:hypothetical protein